MKRDKSLIWRRVDPSSLDLKGRRFMASRGASLLVVGQTFRDSDMSGIDFIKADLSLMNEAQRVGAALPAETFDLFILTTGIFAAPKRQETAEGIERDMAISYLSRLVLVRETGRRLGKERPPGKMKPRVFIMGYPGTGQAGNLDDLNAEKSYGGFAVHMNTVAGNEMLVLDAAKRYPNASFFGLNPGLIETNIRSNYLGADTVRFRFIEWMIGLFSPSADTYAKRLTPLLVSPDLEGHSGAMFNQKGLAILPTPKLTDSSYVNAYIAASEALVSRANVHMSS